MSSQSASSYRNTVIKLQIFTLTLKPCDAAEKAHSIGRDGFPCIPTGQLEAETAKISAALLSENSADADRAKGARCYRVGEVTATVEHVFKLSTNSVALKVRDEAKASSDFVKLFDRKEAAGIRLDELIPAWNEKREKQYHEFIQSGQADKFFALLMVEGDQDRSTDSEISGEPWTVGQEEAFVQYRCQQLFEAEVAAYHALTPLQGICIPRFYSAVVRQPFPNASPAVKKYTSIPGILLEYIRGFRLDRLATYVGRDRWYRICNDAVRGVSAWGTLGVLNRDIKPENCVVRCIEPKAKAEEKSPSKWSRWEFRPFLVDFDAARLRKTGESDEDWKTAKTEVDEVGTMGRLLMEAFRPRWGDTGFRRGYSFHRKLVEQQEASRVIYETSPTDSQTKDVWDDGDEFKYLSDPVAYPQAFLEDGHVDFESDLEEADYKSDSGQNS